MAAQVHRRAAVRAELPRPFRSAWPFLALCAIALALDLEPRLPWVVGFVVAAPFAGAALVRGGRAWWELRRLRSVADRQLLRGVRRPYSPFIAWRAEELIRPEAVARARRPLARLIRDLERVTLPGASPVNRVAARRHLDALRAVDARLEDGAPDGARGVLLLHVFLTSPGSPLYARERAAAFPRALREVLHELDHAD
jgi:hypothetical protein